MFAFQQTFHDLVLVYYERSVCSNWGARNKDATDDKTKLLLLSLSKAPHKTLPSRFLQLKG